MKVDRGEKKEERGDREGREEEEGRKEVSSTFS